MSADGFGAGAGGGCGIVAAGDDCCDLWPRSATETGGGATELRVSATAALMARRSPRVSPARRPFQQQPLPVEMGARLRRFAFGHQQAGSGTVRVAAIERDGWRPASTARRRASSAVVCRS